MLINDNKSSPYNSSISNEFGQWRYFNSALKKLGEAKPVAPNIVAKPTTVDDNEVDWMGALGAAAEGIMGYFDLKKQQGIETANKYLQTHSLEEYRDEMRNGAIPFQDDPFAMQSLASEYGKVYFNAVNQAFADKVAAGEYKELKPEQVDAAFFEFANENLQGAAKDFGFSEDASFFKQGFYENSKAARIKAMMDNVVVRDKDLRAKATVQRNAKITALCNSNEGTVESRGQAILDAFKDCRTAEDVGESFKHFKETVASSPNGKELLDYLEDKIVEPYGVPFNQLIDPDNIKTLKIKSQNVKDTQDTLAYNEFKLQVNDLVADGNVQAVEGMYWLEASNNDALNSTKLKYLQSAREKVREQAKRLQVAAQKDADHQTARIEMTNYLTSVINGTDTEDYLEVKEKYGNIKEEEVTQIAHNLISTAMQNAVDNPDDPKMQKAAANIMMLSTGSDARSKHFRNAMKGMMQTERSKLNGILMSMRNDSAYRLDPNEAGEVNGISVPKSLSTIYNMYLFNPDALTVAFGDEGVDITMACSNLKRGVDPMPFLINKDKAEKQAWLNNGKQAINWGKFYGGNVQPEDERWYGKDYAEWSFKIKKEAPTLSDSEVHKQTLDILKDSSYNVGGAIIPKAEFERVFPNMPLETVKKINFERLGGDVLNESIKKFSAEKREKPEMYQGAFYNKANNVIVVPNINGGDPLIIRSEDFARRIHALYFDSGYNDLQARESVKRADEIVEGTRDAKGRPIGSDGYAEEYYEEVDPATGRTVGKTKKVKPKKFMGTD